MSTPDPDRLMQAIQHRRSIGLQGMLPDPIEPAVIAQLLDAANWGMSHGHTEPWRFHVFSGSQARAGLGAVFAEAYRQITPEAQFKPEVMADWAGRPLKASVWISLGMFRHPTFNKFPEWEDVVALGSAVQNLHLMACAHGLASKWGSGDVVRADHVARHLGLEAPSRLFGFMMIGKPAGTDWPTGQRRPIAEKVTWHQE